MTVPAYNISTEATLPETDPETIDGVHYKPSIERDTYMARHKEVEANDDKQHAPDCKNKVHLFFEYMEHRDQLLNALGSCWPG